MEENQAYRHQRREREKNKVLLHIGLFLITFITTTLAGVDWLRTDPGPYEFDFILYGLPYSLSILFIITCHEFGHYFAAKFHKVAATLPYYIPFPPLPGFLNFGTMGAVIRTKSAVASKKAMFDIGVTGPIAGFIACLIVLVYGFLNVPGEEYILSIHPDYFSPEYGEGAYSLEFGDTLLFAFFRMIFISPGQFFPPMTEIYHYPFLCVGWFGLFITSMNMIPVGQLDGGHISYTLFGDKKHFQISKIAIGILIFLGIAGLLETYFEMPIAFGWVGWLLWSAVLYFIIKLKHPPIPDDSTVDKNRRLIGYISFVIFIISFSPRPIVIGF
jgi:membrane-associated protease RseP (regulator of RpoE activity)